MHELVGVTERAPADEVEAPRRSLLSLCAMTRTGSARLAAVLELLRPLASQVVVALDERAEAQAARLAAVADEVILFPHRDPCDSPIPWLHAQCHGSWILNLDDDEVPSSGLLAHLPELLAAPVTHWWLPRRWLVGTHETFLDEPPWVPDYQLRLYRNDPATLSFSDEFHRPVVVSGPAGFARDPLWHLDCILNPFERRRQKAIAYERARRGMRVAGLAHNGGFYLPELSPGARTSRVPRPDLRLIRTVLAEPLPVAGTRQGSVRRVSREEVDALWPGEPYDRSLYTATLTRVDTLARLPVLGRHTVTVAVENLSGRMWGRGSQASPLIQVGTRWLGEDGDLVEDGIHTPLPADLPSGDSLDVPVHLRAPRRPGSYRLSIDLVHEHVRWFGSALEWTVHVVPAHRIALIGGGQPLEDALDRLQLEPELEPVILGRDETITSGRYGHEHAPGLGGYLLAGIDDRIGPVELAHLVVRTARLLRRARRLRAAKPSAPLPNGAEECLTSLTSCERLHVIGPDWRDGAALTRQLWRLAATAAAARRLGLAVESEPDALTPADLADRLLIRLIRGS